MTLTALLPAREVLGSELSVRDQERRRIEIRAAQGAFGRITPEGRWRLAESEAGRWWLRKTGFFWGDRFEAYDEAGERLRAWSQFDRVADPESFMLGLESGRRLRWGDATHGQSKWIRDIGYSVLWSFQLLDDGRPMVAFYYPPSVLQRKRRRAESWERREVLRILIDPEARASKLGLVVLLGVYSLQERSPAG